jgi:hypothetical protein
MTGPDEEMVTLRVTRRQLGQLVELLGDPGHDQRVHDAGRAAGRQEAVTGTYRDGWELGHDTGLAARQDSRAFVAGVREGWDAGCHERQALAETLIRQSYRQAATQSFPARQPGPAQIRHRQAPHARRDDADLEAAS